MSVILSDIQLQVQDMKSKKAQHLKPFFFKKGHSSWNKGKHWSEEFKRKSSIRHTTIGKEKGICTVCNKTFEFYKSSGRNGNFCSLSCFYKKNGLVKKICPFCKKPFEVKFSQRDKKFCSRACSYKQHSFDGTIVKRCEKCGKNFIRPKATNPGQRFCSILCAGKSGKTLIINCIICNKEIQTSQCFKGKKKYCSTECKNIANGINRRGMKYSDETNKKISEAKSLYWSTVLPNHSSDPENKRNKLLSKIRHVVEYEEWRNKILLRDCYTCQSCGRSTLELDYLQLHVHHEKALFRILIENKISNLEEARACKEIWDINNGVTLCRECHEETDTYMGNFFLSKDFIDITSKTW